MNLKIELINKQGKVILYNNRIYGDSKQFLQLITNTNIDNMSKIELEQLQNTIKLNKFIASGEKFDCLFKYGCCLDFISPQLPNRKIRYDGIHIIIN